MAVIGKQFMENEQLGGDTISHQGVGIFVYFQTTVAYICFYCSYNSKIRHVSLFYFFPFLNFFTHSGIFLPILE